METLAPDQRDLIRRVFFEGKTLTTVAGECGVSYQAVQNRLNKIFRQLRKDLT
jgi:DNA-directed RNA polymerase specialized sigma24 family protein